MQSKPEYPMRINKYLAHKGYATRKAADELIEKHRPSLERLALRFNPYVDKAAYTIFLKGCKCRHTAVSATLDFQLT